MEHVQMPVRVPPFRGQELQLELIDAGTVTLLRSYQYPHADWEPPPVEFRTNRQLGRVYAIWHSRKEDLDLSASVERPLLTEDPEFPAFLAAHPFIDLLRTAASDELGKPQLAAA